MKIFVYEMKKILIKQYAIIILAAVVIVRLNLLCRSQSRHTDLTLPQSERNILR